MSRLPKLSTDDTVVFLGDYVDRGPQSAQVVDFLRTRLPSIPPKVITLRGNHEDAWLRVIREGWPGFILPPGNGCQECLRSYVGDPPADPEEEKAYFEKMFSGTFFPKDVIEWMEGLPHWYEDEHAIYVHAGLPRIDGRWLHPSEVQEPTKLLWARDSEFFSDYRGKQVVCGHTLTSCLPKDLSSYTPSIDDDMWVGPSVTALDTGCGKEDGFLTALELPPFFVYESR